MLAGLAVLVSIESWICHVHTCMHLPVVASFGLLLRRPLAPQRFKFSFQPPVFLLDGA